MLYFFGGDGAVEGSDAGTAATLDGGTGTVDAASGNVGLLLK